MTQVPRIVGLVATLASVIASAAIASAAFAAPDGILRNETGAATYFNSPGDRALYYNEKEASQGEIICVGECTAIWIPFSADVDDATDDTWSVISRPDETLQWAYKGRPLYTYLRDTFPGARTGDESGRGVWKLLKEFKTVPAGMNLEVTLLGYVLADHAGHTLYTRNVSSDDEAANVDSSNSLWEPFEAPWLAVDQGDWTTGDVAGGVRQWRYKGQRLYTFKRDIDPGDINGHGTGDAASAVILEKAPGLPAWMTVQLTDIGLAYADQNGMTLYAPIDIDVIRAAQSCPEDCIRENWRPVLAQPGEESVGNWIIRENDEGERQWSYKGRLAYTHTRDEAPGDMRGHGIAVGYRIGDGWRIIPVESGLRRDRI